MRVPRYFRAPSRLLAGLVVAAVAAAGLPAQAALAQPDAPPSAAPKAAAAAAPAGPRDYFYDAAGQLAGVADKATGSAAYRYDAAGNLLGTDRLAADALAVFAVTPARGPAGTVVEIGGVGFGTTAATNAVTVDGIAAPVTALTANRLTVTIPAGATDGVIEVKAAGKTARSPQPFKVERGTPVPAITALSTDRGNKNDLVTITGTGFDPDKTRDVVMFHRTVAQVQSATATSLTVRIPAAAASGKVTVRTPGGVATSAADFFVAPRGFVMSNLVVGGRTGAGKPAITTTIPAGKAGLVLIDGTAGESVNLKFDSNTIKARSALWLYTPFGGNFARNSLGDPLDLWTSATLSQDLPKLTETGTYALVIVPNDAAAGAVRVTASNTLTGSKLATDGSGVPFQITQSLQTISFPFTNATANKWLSLGMTDLSKPANTITVTVKAPDGSVQTWASIDLTRYTPTMVFKAKQAGAYTATVQFAANQLGFGKLWLSETIEAGTLAINGAAVGMTIQRPGQSVRLPFTGAIGQTLQLGFTENTLLDNDRPAYPSTIMSEPDDRQVELRTGSAETRDIPKLTKAGTHSIFITGWMAVGSVKVWLSTQVEGGVFAVNTQKTITIDRPGRDMYFDFNGTAGRSIFITSLDKRLPGEVNFKLYRPSGSSLLSGRSIDYDVLPDTGKYRIQVDPESPGTGTLSVAVTETLDVGNLAVDAPPTALSMPLPIKRVAGRFTGAVGQRLTLTAPSAVHDWWSLKVFKPDNTQLDFFGATYMPYGLDLPALPVAGVYRFEMWWYQTTYTTGDFSMLLSSEVDAGKATVDGDTIHPVITRPGQNARFTFDATAGAQLDMVSGGVMVDPYGGYYTIYGPTGAVFQRRISIWYLRERLPTFSTAGTYTVVLDPAQAITGTSDITIKKRTTPLAKLSTAKLKPAAALEAKPCATEPAEDNTLGAPVPKDGVSLPAGPEKQAVKPAECADGGWKPDAKNLGGEDWKTRNEPAPSRDRALEFPVGITGVAGRVLDTADKPLAGVTVSVGDKKTKTDGGGRFVLTGVPGGKLALRVDGRAAKSGVFEIAVEVKRGSVLVLPYTVFLPELDTAGTVKVDSPTTKEVVLTTKAIPGLEVHIPRGTVVRDADGKVVRELNLTAIPIDRPPFPLPPTRVPVYFTVQPGGGVLFPAGARVVYPNYTKEPPGTRTQFWNYDPTGKGWHIYGLGKVSADGKQIVPDAGVRFYRLTGAMTAVPGMNPPPVAPRPNGIRIADPVDPATGLLVDEAVDLTVNDVMPIQIKRTYQQGDPDIRQFGVGTSFDYGMFPWSPGVIGSFDFKQFDLIQPDGSKVHYTRTSPGDDYAGAIFAADPTPTAYGGSVVRWNGDGWDVEMRDGTVIVLGDESPMQAIRDKFGNTTTITRATAVPGVDGKVRQNGAITQITSPNGRWVRFSYDAANPPKVTGVEDNIGRKVSYEYDSTGHLRLVKNAEQGVTEYTWDTAGRMKSVKNPRQIEYVVNEYDTNGRVRTQKGADGEVTTFDYTAVNGVVSETKMTDPRGHVRRLTFNDKGFPVSDTKAFGTALAQTTATEYDSSGVRVAATVDALNRRTTYVYDAVGKVKEATQLAGTTLAKTQKWEYTGPHAELTKSTDIYNKATVYELDARGAVKSVTDPMLRKTTMVVDGSGLVTSVTDPALKTIRTDYAGSDPVKVTDSLNRATRAGFDAIGRAVWDADARGGITDTTYDAAGRIRSVTDPLGRTTGYDYDADGNRTKVTDARQHSTVFGFDEMERVETITDPLGRAESFEYDENGNLKKHTSRRGIVTEQDYDELDRVKETRFGSESTVTQQYDLGDRLRRTEDSASGVSTIDYDDLDRVKVETTSSGTVTYDYGATVRDRTMTVAGHTPIRHVFDANGELAEIQHGGTAVLSVGRDTVGRPSRVGAPATTGISQNYVYTDAGQIKTITYKAGTTTLGDLGYEYDAIGEPVRTTGTYSRTQLPEAYGPATYDDANRLGSVNGTTVAYDDDGNLTSDGTTSYAWNARDQMSGLTRDGLSASFGYAADGRRLSRTVNGTTTTYLYDGENPLQEKVGGVVTATMTAGGLDGFQIRESGGTLKRYLTDALGSTLGLVDDTGAGASYAYEPFGKTTVTGNDGGNAYRFTGREDDGTGLYNYRQRYYSPTLQRFLSEDPAGFEGGINLQAYVGNQPTELRDPTGEQPKGTCLANVCGPNGEPIYEIPGGMSGGGTAKGKITKPILGDFNIGVNKNPAYPAPLCSYCRANPANSVDHVDARIHGGNLDPKNLTPACGHCNPSKNNRIVPKNPPKGYTGTWPPSWWPKSMIQEWYLLYAG